MSIKIYVAASTDRYVEMLLQKIGMQASSIGDDDLRELSMPNAPQPAVVVLDLRKNPHLPDTLCLLQRNHPNTPVIVVAATLEPGLILEAMRAGIKEIVPEPLSRTDLENAIRGVLNKRPVPGTGPIYAFVGAKGGVGNTTLAVNVASTINQAAEEGTLARDAHSSALLIDLHVTYGDCALFLGAEPKFSIVDALENSHRFDDAFFKGVVARTPGAPDLLASSERLMLTPIDARRIQALIEFASYRYSHVVLDVARSDSVVLDALSPVTTFAVVVSQDLATLGSGRAIASALRQRYGKEKVQVVLNRRDAQAEITQEDVEQAIGEPLAFAFPSDYRTAVQAVNRGTPLVADGNSKLAIAMREFARRLAGLKTEKPAAVAADRSSLFARLIPRRVLGG